MSRFLLRRLGQAAITIYLISLIIFLVVYFIPGDPVTIMLGTMGTPQEAATLRHEFGLDKPLYLRYALWLWHALHLDLGSSILYGKSVIGEVMDVFPVTLELTLLALVVALLIAVPAGIIAGVRQHTWIDFTARSTSFLGQSIPGFWLGLMLIWLLAVRVPLFPTYGFTNLRDDVWQNLRCMALPAFTLGIYVSAPLTRYLRAGIIRTLSEDYVLTARSKGITGRQVIVRHVARNSLIPFVTQLGLQLAYLLGGAVVIEQVFSLPGMGYLALTAFRSRDYPVIQGVVLVVAGGFVLINLAVDVLYSVLDPRIRLEGTAQG
jgi:peptide/nickel transport system permease protein